MVSGVTASVPEKRKCARKQSPFFTGKKDFTTSQAQGQPFSEKIWPQSDPSNPPGRRLISGPSPVGFPGTEQRQREDRLHSRLFGLLNCGAALLFVLPRFGQAGPAGTVESVSLPALTGLTPLMRCACLALTAALAVTGVLTLALLGCASPLWLRAKEKVSMGLSILAVLLFMAGQQPYAAALLFVFLLIKAFSRFKWA